MNVGYRPAAWKYTASVPQSAYDMWFGAMITGPLLGMFSCPAHLFLTKVWMTGGNKITVNRRQARDCELLIYDRPSIND